MSVKSNSDEESGRLKPIRRMTVRLKSILRKPAWLKTIFQNPNRHNQRRIVRHWIFSVLFKRGVVYSLIITLVIFALYVIVGIPDPQPRPTVEGSPLDPGIPDRLMFLLLRLLWYSSLLLCAFSLFAMGYRIRRLVFHPSLRNIVGLFLYFFAGLFGAALAIFNSFIIAASSGNL
jgi:hypothetical protein